MARVVEEDEDGPGVSEEERKKRQRIRDKRTGKAQEDEWAGEDRAKHQSYMASIAPPQIVEPRCSVCKHPYREWIEQLVVKGYADLHIAEHIPEVIDPATEKPVVKPNRKSIKTHYEEHLRLEERMVRAELDEEAKALDQNIEEGISGARSLRGMLRVLITKTFEEAQAGIVNVEARDMIQMIKTLNEMEVKTSGDKAEHAEFALRVFVEAIRAICDDDQMTLIAAEVKRLRASQDIKRQMEDMLVMPPPPAIIQATVIDEASPSQRAITQRD